MGVVCNKAHVVIKMYITVLRTKLHKHTYNGMVSSLCEYLLWLHDWRIIPCHHIVSTCRMSMTWRGEGLTSRQFCGRRGYWWVRMRGDTRIHNRYATWLMGVANKWKHRWLGESEECYACVCVCVCTYVQCSPRLCGGVQEGSILLLHLLQRAE